MMKLLLTSNGLANASITDSLERLVGKPRFDIKIAFIPTAAFPGDETKHESREWLIDDMHNVKDFCGFIDVVSLTDLAPEDIMHRLEYADVIFVGGGNVFYLSYWMETVGLFERLPKLLESRVYAGISAGSMIATKSIRTASQAIMNTTAFNESRYDELGLSGRSLGKAAGLVDFVIRPHLNRVRFPGEQGEVFKAIVDDVKVSLYAIDDDSAIVVEDGRISVVGEGHWELIQR